MPTYEYRCLQGHEFELFQRISDDPVSVCPECGERAQRVISGGAGFLFKGEGFYITDYRSAEYKKKAAKEAPSGSEAKAGDTGKSAGQGTGQGTAKGASSGGGSDGASGDRGSTSSSSSSSSD